MIVVNPQANLLEVIATTHSTRGFSRSLDGRQKQADQDADNGDNDK
jgi:hypothetical protein